MASLKFKINNKKYGKTSSAERYTSCAEQNEHIGFAFMFIT